LFPFCKDKEEKKFFFPFRNFLPLFSLSSFAQSHIGTKNSNNAMNSYIFKRRVDGRIFLLNFLRVHGTTHALFFSTNSQSGSACALPIF